MKKILIVFDGINFSETSFDFARKLNEKERILLVGAFLPQVSFADLWAISAAAGVTTFPNLEDDEEKKIIEQNMERFSEHCESEGIDYRIHQNIYDFTVPVLEKETSFVDLMIIDSELFYREITNKFPIFTWKIPSSISTAR